MLVAVASKIYGALNTNRDYSTSSLAAYKNSIAMTHAVIKLQFHFFGDQRNKRKNNDNICQHGQNS